MRTAEIVVLRYGKSKDNWNWNSFITAANHLKMMLSVLKATLPVMALPSSF